jgi:hypothetical protein
VTWVKHVLVCVNVRRDSLTKRHGGHGLAYAYVASMLATFASRVAFAGLQMHFFPAPGDGRVERRLWEATACWAIVNALPASWFLYACGPKPPARVARAAMYLAAALNKYRQVRRAATATANVERVVARVAIVACVGAASTLSRAVTDQWVTGAAEDGGEVWLQALVRVAREAAVNAGYGAWEMAAASGALERALGGWRAMACAAQDGRWLCAPGEWDAVTIARQTARVALMAVLAARYAAKANRSVTRWKVKPPGGAKKVKTT